MYTYISSSPLAVNDFSTMNTFVIAMEKARIAAVNCQITTLMSFRIVNRAIWMVPMSLNCSRNSKRQAQCVSAVEIARHGKNSVVDRRSRHNKRS